MRVAGLRLAGVLASSLLAAMPARPISAQPAGRPSIPELTARLQAHYDTIRDFSADFTHVYEGGLLRQRATERGTVLIKRPGRMRWTYTSPERKEFVADGVKLYAYIPQDKQVIVSAMPVGDEATSAAMFLAGKGRLGRDFAVSYADLPDTPPDAYAVKLVPLQRQADYDWLMLVVDRQSLVMRRLVTVDSQGGQSSFLFTNLKENVGLADSRFEFKIPRGVDVISESGRAR